MCQAHIKVMLPSRKTPVAFSAQPGGVMDVTTRFYIEKAIRVPPLEDFKFYLH
jgi:hypothetical protein